MQWGLKRDYISQKGQDHKTRKTEIMTNNHQIGAEYCTRSQPIMIKTGTVFNISLTSSNTRVAAVQPAACWNTLAWHPVLKAYRKWCVKFRTTPSLRTGLILLNSIASAHPLGPVTMHLKPKTSKALIWAKVFFFLGAQMRSAPKLVGATSIYGYPS